VTIEATMEKRHNTLATLLPVSEEWLMNRVLGYARRTDYTRYTSTLQEAWRVSIAGLSSALVNATARGPMKDLQPDEDHLQDPCAAFGIQEARRHRSRGVSLSMFLGLMKYYRRSYEDLVWTSRLALDLRSQFLRDITLFFDRVELGFSTEWCEAGREANASDMSDATRALANEKNLLLTIFESLEDPVVCFREDGSVASINRAASMAFAGRDIPGASHYGTVRPDSRVLADARHKAMSSPNVPVHLLENVETQQGRRAFELRLRPMLDASGKFAGTVANFHDVTDAMALKRANDEKEARYQDLFENMQDAFAAHEILLDASGAPVDYRFLAVNPAFERMTGLKAGAIVGKRVKEVLPGTERHWIDAYGKVALTGETLRLENFSADLGKHYEVYAYRPRAGQFACVFRDITERKRVEEEHRRLQDQLFQAQKVESVGRLAGGVAHDFNNMLGVILGHTELALDALPADNPLREDLEQINHAAHRSADITRQLLAFARKQTIVPRVLDLNASLEPTLQMMRRLIGEDIELCFAPGPNLWNVKIDPAQVDQVVANLATNARDAIGGVGHVRVETRNLRVEAHGAVQAVPPGEYVCLAVTDNGSGIQKEKLANIFEPFFTTKEQGKGTGLGLATVYGIVQQNAGFITVESAPGQGSTFRIHLPRCEGAVDGAHAPAPSPGNGVETVLVVEDELAGLRVAQRYLESLGYQVLAAADPLEALALARNHAVQLLVTDVVMPRMNGHQLMENLTGTLPGLRSLFMSGHTADVIAHNGVLPQGTHFIQKPFSLREFGTKVRQVLDAH
jgi:PAS domain S-box-containing protein